jgi:sugar diacid utilization regulator
MGFDFCAVTLPDPNCQVLRFEGSYGLSAEYITEVNSVNPIRISHGPHAAPSSEAFLTGKPTQIVDTVTHPAFDLWSGVARDQGFVSMVSVPLMSREENIGTLNCYTIERHHFDEEIPLLAMLADQAAISITAATLRKQQAQSIHSLNVANASLEEQYELQRQATNIHDRLTAISLEGGGLAELAEVLSGILNKPLAIRSPEGQLLYSTNRGADAIPQVFSSKEVHVPALAFDSSPAIASIEVQSEAGIISSVSYAPVILQRETAAWICFPGSPSNLQPLELRAVEHTATVLALELLRSRAAAETEWRRSDEILSAILNGQIRDMRALLDRSRRLGHSISQLPHAVLVLRGSSVKDDLVRYRLADAFQFIADGQTHKPMLGIHQGYVVVFWPILNMDTRVWSDIVQTIRRACGIGETVEQILTAVISPVYDLDSYERAYRIGRGAVELAALRGMADEVFQLDELGMASIFLQFEDPTELDRYTHSVLEPLYSYEGNARVGSELFPTLVRLIENDLSASKTARDLYIHKNTVIQRRHRIEKLLHKNLSHVWDMSEIAIAVCIEEVLYNGIVV